MAVKRIAEYFEIDVSLVRFQSGAWCANGLEFLNDLSRRISDVTGDTRDTGFLFQRLSIAFQKRDAACMYKPGQARLVCRHIFDFIPLSQ